MFLDSEFPPDPRVENEAITLIENGFEIHLLSLSRDKNRPAYEIINGIHVHRKYISNLTYRLSALAYSLPLYHLIIRPLIRKFIKETTPNFLHIHDMLIARAVFDVNKNKLPVTLDLHENRPEIMKYYPHLQAGLGKILISPAAWKKWQVKLVQLADRVITVTSLAKEQLVEESGIDPGKVVVVPNTIRRDVFYSYRIEDEIISQLKDRKVILYLGDTGLRRGTESAIRATASLAQEFPDILLVLVGKSSEDDMLRDLVAELNIEDFVRLEGWQDVSLFPSYIKAASVAISPLKRNPHHDTTYANKLFQYMAYGKPLVVSDCPAQAQLVEEVECGLVHQAEDVDDMASQLGKLLIDPLLAESLGQNGKEAVNNNYEWGKTSLDLVELYRSFDKKKN